MTRTPDGPTRSPAPVRAPARRLGVAVELPEPYGAELARVRRAAGDPAADHMPPHITLVPPVVVQDDGEDAVEVLRSAAQRVAPFEVHLRGTGSFRPVSDVVFVAVSEGIGSLEQLAQVLRVRPFNPRRQFPFHPHVTIAQDVAPAALDEAYERMAAFQASFRVGEFRLYEHDGRVAGGHDRCWYGIADFALGGI